MSVDRRTRVDGTEAPVGTPLDTVRAAFEAGGSALRDAAASLGLRPLTVEVDGEPITLTDDVTARSGRAEGDSVRLRRDQWDDLVTDQVTPTGLFSSGQLDLTGRLERLLDWWLVLRGGLDDRLPHRPGDVDRLEAHRAFGLDDLDAAGRFLASNGYCHLEGVYAEAEMAELSADMDRIAPTYYRGDGRSWWARNGDGDDLLVRMQRPDSPSLAALLAGDRYLALADLTPDGHVATGGAEMLFKPLGVAEGISDVPWHKDCALGRHSYECCSLTVGISVSGAGPTSGQLRVVAGSHRALVWPSFVRSDNDLPVIDLPTSTGDVTVHLSCTLHMAQPPTERERRVVYADFRLPPLDPAAADAGRRKLRGIREAAPVSVSQPRAV